ncbi:MAG: DUF6585 family protein [Cyanobacteria bacterium P01_A01_bin.123]
MAHRTPKSINQLATTHNLGNLVDSHQSSSEMVLLLAILVTLGAVVSLYVFVAGYPIFGALIAIASAGLLYLAIARNSLYIYEEGLIHVSAWGRYITRYDQIETVWQRIVKILDQNLRHQTTEYLYTIQDRRGKRLMLRLPTVGQWIQARVLECKMPQIRSDYQAGNPIWFKTLGITREGFLKKSPMAQTGQSASLPWSAVEAVRYAEGTVTIWATGPKPKRWAQVADYEIPNFPIFETLLAETCGIQRGGTPAPLSPWNWTKQFLTGGLR